MASRFQDLTRPNAQPQGFFWYTDPLAWRLDVIGTIPRERRIEWIAVHHQVLMLAEQQNSGHGLWFRYQNEGSSRSLYGVLLPGEMVVALGPGEPTAIEHDLSLWNKATARLPFRFWMGEERLLAGLSKHQPEFQQDVRIRRPAPTKPVSSLELKRATSADFERVLSWSTAFARETHQDIESTRHEVLDLIKTGHLVVAATTEPIGMLALSNSLVLAPETAMTRISLVYIDHKHRRTGLGSLMMNAVVQEIAMESVQHCVLFADSSNVSSAEFYSKLGFEICGTWVKVTTTGK